MSITKISNTRKATALINYVLNEKAHDGSGERYVSVSAFNCTVGNAVNEFKSIRTRYNKENNIQAYTIIQSWGKDELDPENDDDINKAQESANRLARDIAGDDRQIIVAIQKDGDGGNLHAHIIINSVDMLTGKSLRGNKLHHNYIMRKSDKIQDELGILNKNKELNEYTEKQSIQEIKARAKGSYVWKDDLKERIENCMENPNIQSYEDFKQSLKDEYNVEVTERKSKNKEAYAGYLLTYSFIDKNNKKRKVRQTRLGTTFGLKGIEYGIETNKDRQPTVVTQFKQYEVEHDEREYTRNRQSTKPCKQKSRSLSEQARQLEHSNETIRQRELEKERAGERVRQLERHHRQLELEYKRQFERSKQRSL